MVVARMGAPLLLGLGENENFAASDTSALLQVTQQGDLPRGRRLRRGDAGRRAHRRDAHGREVERPTARDASSPPTSVELGSYSHYMQKEIFEQPRAVRRHARARGERRSPSPRRSSAREAEPDLRATSTRCWSSPAAPASTRAWSARYWIESHRRRPLQRRDRERVPLPHVGAEPAPAGGRHLAVGRDRRHARRARARASRSASRTRSPSATWPSPRIVRAAALRFLTRAGPEIGVASTKAFTTQLASLLLLALAHRQGARQALRRARRPSCSRRCARCPTSLHRALRDRGPDHRLVGASSRCASTRSSSAAASTTRSRWKAR